MPKWFAPERIGSALAPCKVLGRVDPLGLAGALVQVGTRTATDALPRRVVGLGVELAKVAVGKSTIAPDPKDWRFQNRAWTTHPLFNRLCQSYLAWAETSERWRRRRGTRLADGSGPSFATSLSRRAGADQPFLLNPDALERRLRDGGQERA